MMRRPFVLNLTVSLALLLSCGDDSSPQTDADGNDDADDTGNSDDDATGDASDGTDDGGDASDTDATDDGSDDSNTDDGGTDGETIEVHEFRVDFSPPAEEETYYACFPITIPTDQVVHLVGFRPSIASSQIHHYVLAVNEDGEDVAPGTPCYDWPGATIWGWAPGIEEWTLPEDVGFPSGEDGTVDLMLQIHYNNPLAQSFHDTSGVDVLYTETLREHDAGVLTIGDIENLDIPPGNPAYEHVATCTSNQTTLLLPEPITVFAAWLHAHEIGAEIWTDHFRGGSMIGEIGHDDPYHFDGQHFRPVDAVIEQGDELRTHCIFDSSDRTEPTRGGYGTVDEMCVNFLFYYPAVTGQRCGNL